MNTNTKGHILFVDDDVVTRNTLAVSLRDKGYEVTECGDGLEAFNWLRQNRADFLITGIKMPNLGGFELIERLKQDPRWQALPFFIFSHRGDPTDRERAKTMGAADFFVYGFVTPNDIAEVLARVKPPAP